MKKFASFLLLACLSLTTAMATGEPNTLVVKLLSGETTDYYLYTKPKLLFTGSELIVKSDSYEASYQLSQLDRYYFIHSDINVVDSPEGDTPGMSRNGERLVFSGLLPNATVSVYSTSGNEVGKVKATSDGCATLSLSPLPQGVYIVKYGNVTTKIQKR